VRRLTFAFRDGAVELVSEQRVEMRLPARSAPRVAAARAEFWYELRNAQSDVLYRLDSADPIPTDVEVFSDDPERTVERAPHAPQEGVFTVLLPEIEDAEEVRLMRAAPATEGAVDVRAGAAEAAVEVGRFRLTEK